MKKLRLAFFFMTICFTTSIVAQNFELNFEIVNKTGIDLSGVYVTDTDLNNWGEDLNPNDKFENNATLNITIPIDDQTMCEYDIRITDDADNAIEFTTMDFCKLETHTL